MSAERFVTLGLAGARSPWFTAVGRWATVGSIPVEFVKCMSVEEVRARLGSGRPWSALLVDAGLGVVDRDLVHLAESHGCALVVVGADPAAAALGITARLPTEFERQDLLDVLEGHARRIAVGGAGLDADSRSRGADPADLASAGWRGRLVVVVGGGGAGTSTVAAALAQGLGGDARLGGMVLLGDFALQADQAMLHDVGDVVPGVPELLDLHRSGEPAPDQVRALTFEVPDRGYHLLLGLRRHVDWVSLRPRAFEAAVDGLRRSFSMVVADADADLEGQEQCGSVDVEERNVMARTLASEADLVLLVGTPSVKGMHGLVRQVGEYRRHGVAPGRLLAVVNRAPRSPRARSELCRAFAELSELADPARSASSAGRAGAVAPAASGPLFLPDRRWLDDVHRDRSRFPSWFTVTLVGAVESLLDQPGRRASTTSDPVPVVPGSLGRWTDQEVAGR